MTEKSMKNLKNKNKHLKLKKTNVQQQQQPKHSKVFESDSDISEPDDGKIRPKMDHRELNQISSEVTDLLATLKKEHGIDNDDNDDELVKLPSSKKDKKKLDQINNKTKQQQKKRAASAENVLISEVKKLKVEDKMQKQQTKSKKVKSTNQTVDDMKMELDDTNDNVNEAPENSPKKKKKKNKKRPAAAAANVDDGDDDDMDVTAAPQAKKIKTVPNQNPKQKSNVVKKDEKKQTLNGGEDNAQEDANQVKKQHHLKNSVPVYVGNLPINIKRLKLVKLFKKFGEVLSIRFRTNAGKTFFKKSEVKKAPFLIAFVYFKTREEAEASLALNGTEIGDHKISVDLDAERRVEDNHSQANTVVVGNLKYAVTEQILREAFKCCGKIEHVRTVQGPLGCKGIAFIYFAKPESCELALKLHGTEILNREVRVERHQAKKKAQKKIKKEKMSPKQQKFKKNAAKRGEDGQLKNAEVDGGGDSDGIHKKLGKKKKNKGKTVKEFMGTKSVDNKKSLNQKKKKKNKLSQEKRLAKKVASKSEKAAASA